MHSDMYARPLRVPWVPTRGLLDVSKGTDVLDPVSSEVVKQVVSSQVPIQARRVLPSSGVRTGGQLGENNARVVQLQLAHDLPHRRRKG